MGGGGLGGEEGRGGQVSLHTHKKKAERLLFVVVNKMINRKIRIGTNVKKKVKTKKDR